MEKALSVSLPPSNYLPAPENGLSLVKESKRYEQNYRVFRINLKSIDVDERTRDIILNFMNQGKKFVQIDNYTLMLNSISSIEPLERRTAQDEKLIKLMEERTENELATN